MLRGLLCRPLPRSQLRILSSSSNTTLLLVHGAWLDGSVWSPLRAELTALGVESVAVSLPGHGPESSLSYGDMYADARLVREAVDSCGSAQVALVGFSYGGVVVTEAAVGCGTLKHVVYLAAYTPERGQSTMDLIRGFEPNPHFRYGEHFRSVPGRKGFTAISPEAAPELFLGGVPSELGSETTPRLCPQPHVTFTQPISGSPPWRAGIPSSYIVCTADKAILPSHQRQMALKCEAVYELDSPHLAMVAKPKPLARCLQRILTPDDYIGS